MILRKRVALDGVQLDGVDDRIVIQGIETAAGKQQIQAQSLWGAGGSRVTGETRDSLDITVRFTINEKSYRPAERAEVLEKVNTWAAMGGWLTAAQKPGRRVRVIAAQLAAEGDPGKRASYALVFRAYAVPYWQEEEAAKVRITGSSGSRAFGVGGNQKTVMEASFQNTSGSTVDTLTVTAGGSVLRFTGLGLQSGKTLRIDHTDDGRRSVLRCRIGNTSVLNKRTPGSSNDLTVLPGERTVSFTAGGSGTMEFSCRGRFG